METDRYVVKVTPGGDTFVAEVDEDGMIYAQSIALHVEEWSGDGGYTVREDLDLFAFDLEPADEPFPDSNYAYLTY